MVSQPVMRYGLGMKDFLFTLVVVVIFTFVAGGGALLWHLSATTEFSRADAAPAAR